MNETAKDSRSGWILYTFLCLCRVAAAFLPGYVHPDEFFQGGQELWFGCPPSTPWEFEAQNALRSVMPPTVMTWVPLRFYAWVMGSDIFNLAGIEILVFPRIFCGILSILTVDISVWHMTASSGRSGTAATLIVASAWPSWVMLNRPFSNALETMLLALLLLVTSQPHQNITDLVAGMICALGLFSRFTFIFFSLPTMLRFIADKASFRAKRALFGIGLLGVGFLGTSAGVLCADVKYYKGADQWTSYIAPLNALLYNSKETNLQDHGLHPRWTHALANMFLLYGPLAVLLYLRVFSGKSIQSLFSKKRQAETEVAVKQARIPRTCAWTILSGLGFLSLAPHQEPRFLLPLLVPLAILSAPSLKSTWVLVVWILFNVILLIVYAIFHQGGVVPSLLSRAIPNRAPRTVFYYHTYMPPTFSWRKRNEALVEECLAENSDPVSGSDDCSTATLGCGNIPIIDLKGSSVDTLTSALSEQITCDNGDHKSKDSTNYVYLVAPPFKTGTVVLGHDCFVGESYNCRLLRSFRPHLTTEDFHPFDGSLVTALWSMELCVFEISCN